MVWTTLMVSLPQTFVPQAPSSTLREHAQRSAQETIPRLNTTSQAISLASQ